MEVTNKAIEIILIGIKEEEGLYLNGVYKCLQYIKLL